MNTFRMLLNLWKCDDKADVLKVIGKVAHRTKPIAKRVNNIGEAELGTNPFAAIIEGVTNAHDAVIRDALAQHTFQTRPATIAAALEVLSKNDPRVHIYHQRGGGTKLRTITITDQGCGMDETGMVKGVLNFGSDDKMVDLLQHGNYGMGGGSLFGKSQASLIISRTRKSDRYHFTVVYKDEPDDERLPESYVYVTREDGRLFSIPAADIEEFYEPGHDWAANYENKLILPQHGTVRRQYGMPVEYWGFHKSSLYTAIPDGLFGSPGVVRLVGYENTGRQNHRRGRRHDLNAVAVGAKMPYTDAEMLYKRAPTPITIYDGKQALGEVRIAIWVVGPWGDDPSKPAKTIVHNMLDGDDRGPPHGILVTIAGQTHGRLRSTIPVRNAGLINLTSLLVIEVELDLLPRKVRRKIVSSDRTRLDDTFSQRLEHEIIDLLKHDEELQHLSRKLEPAVSKMPVTAELQKLTKDLMNDPLVGLLAGFDVAGQPKAVTQTGVVTQKVGPGSNITTPRRRANPIAFEPVDPPTFVEVGRQTIRCSRTGWIAVETDAPDHYADRITLTLPPCVVCVPGSVARLRRGRYVQQVTVLNGCPPGTQGEVGVTLALPNGAALNAAGTLDVVAERAPVPPKDGDVGSIEQQIPGLTAFPAIRLEEIDGCAAASYASLFGTIDETDAILNFDLDADTNNLTVYINKKFTGCEQIRPVLIQKYRADGEVLFENFTQTMTMYYMAFAIMFCRQEIDPSDVATQRIIATAVRSHAIMTCHKFADGEYRRALLMRAKSSAE